MRDREQGDDIDSEVTLSPASLLGIFLGLVLICGVFFGFGYSVGRRTTTGGSAPASTDSDAEGTDTLTTPIAKPSAAHTFNAAAAEDGSLSGDTLLETASPATAAVPVADGPSAAKAPANDAGTAAARGVLNQAAGNQAAGTEPAPSAAPAAAASPASGSQPETGRTVVQVAAVTRQEDAEILVSALRQRGYRAMERNEPQDKLLHVQVGPFSSRAEANAARQKLLADGYNAFLKQ